MTSGSSHEQVALGLARADRGDATVSTTTRDGRVAGSALWAAYGDALGFISELTDAQGLKRRTRGRELTTPLSWSRRIGGRQGVTVTLPEGCYSDDTQLRLSTGRAIGPKGFDVEAFAKVELPVWPAYALGGGKGTKAAAAHLGRDQALWYANDFPGWTEGGGNGAAMRIQPHVWAATELSEPSSYLPDVLRNAVTTHGHPAGIVGAALHAQAVAHAISAGTVPSPADVASQLDVVRGLLKSLRDDPQLGEIWLRMWEQSAGRKLDVAWEDEIATASAALKDAVLAVEQKGPSDERYVAMLHRLALFEPARRGSGTLTALAALGLAWLETDPVRAIQIAAKAVGSDTDTIATMTGAILGAVVAEGPLAPVLDADVIEREALRLARLSGGGQEAGHRYPDLLHWSAPRTQSDVIGFCEGRLVVSGLGGADPLPGDAIAARQGDFVWQWVKLQVGPTLLIKSRKELREIHPRALPVSNTLDRDPAHRDLHEVEELKLLDAVETAAVSGEPERTRPAQGDRGVHRPLPPTKLDRGVELQAVLDWLSHQGYDSNEAIGYVVRRVARDGTPDQLAMLMGMLREQLRRLPTSQSPQAGT